MEIGIFFCLSQMKLLQNSIRRIKICINIVYFGKPRRTKDEPVHRLCIWVLLGLLHWIILLFLDTVGYYVLRSCLQVLKNSQELTAACVIGPQYRTAKWNISLWASLQSRANTLSSIRSSLQATQLPPSWSWICEYFIRINRLGFCSDAPIT